MNSDELVSRERWPCRLGLRSHDGADLEFEELKNYLFLVKINLRELDIMFAGDDGFLFLLLISLFFNVCTFVLHGSLLCTNW